jgi:hypothetical protein
MKYSFWYEVIGGQAWDVHDDNIDVQIRLPDGSMYAATFFTVRNINSLFTKNRATGECASGLYLWAANMILVDNLERGTIERAIASLIEEGELASACQRIREGANGDADS